MTTYAFLQKRSHTGAQRYLIRNIGAQHLGESLERTAPASPQSAQHVLSMPCKALFSADVTDKPYTLFTLIHIFEYVQ